MASKTEDFDLGILLSHHDKSLFDTCTEVRGEWEITTTPERLIALIRALKTDKCGSFVCFIDVTGVDYPAREKRFDVVYHLLSPYTNQRVRITIETDEQTPVPSITDIFPGANWFEREAYDMYGILFANHPDLRRMLTDYGFDGHPLRKDFPLTGYSEVRYDDTQKRVVYEELNLNQAYRSFDFTSPWAGTDYDIPNQLKGDEKAS